MKTKKVAARSPMQMTIVAFVLLFVVVTAIILFMYFKWFANDELGAPAAVNVVGVEENVLEKMVEEQQPEPELLNTKKSKQNNLSEIYPMLYDSFLDSRNIESLKQDGIDQIKLDDGFEIITALFSNKKDKIIYFESNGIVDNLVLLDLVSQKTEVIKTEDYHIYEQGSDQHIFLPIEWSVNDKKIILSSFFIGDGFTANDNSLRVLDVNSFEENLSTKNPLAFSDDNKFLVFEEKFSNRKVCGQQAFAPLDYFYYVDQIVMVEIESGKRTILLGPNEYETYGCFGLNENGDLQCYVNPVFKVSGNQKDYNDCYITLSERNLLLDSDGTNWGESGDLQIIKLP